MLAVTATLAVRSDEFLFFCVFKLIIDFKIAVFFLNYFKELCCKNIKGMKISKSEVPFVYIHLVEGILIETND